MDILIIDHDPRSRKSLEDQLRNHQHAVLTAVDGEQALFMCKAAKLDLVIVNNDMLNGDGADLISAVKKHNAQTRIWLFSEGVATLTERIAQKAGAERVVSKSDLALQFREAGILNGS